ncbi:MAG: 50S ribosomal protein L9 [Phycisphaerae bacterium]
MQVLLLKDVRKLGHVGDVVDVTPGYARNYLYPQRLCIEPSEDNLKAIEDRKKHAAVERALRNKAFSEHAEKMKEVSVTIEAAANPEGTLYGSVGPKHVADALRAQGFPVEPAMVMLDPPIRTLDNRMINIEFTDEIAAQVKVWVVREGGVPDEQPADADEPDTDADADDRE